MEIKDIIKELITSAKATFNHSGQPENFDLEDFISVMESYYKELNDLGEFYYEDENNISDEGYYEDDY
jgi:hypothetical protein